jgi:hypothetical protein
MRYSRNGVGRRPSDPATEPAGSPRTLRDTRWGGIMPGIFACCVVARLVELVMLEDLVP